MNKLIIKIGCVVVCVALVLSNSVSFAATKEMTPEKTTSKSTLYEYDVIKELQQFSEGQLIRLGFTPKLAKSIKSEKLKASNKIKKYGTVTYTVKIGRHYYKNGYTYVNSTISWKWSKKPKFRFTDTIRVLTNPNMVAFKMKVGKKNKKKVMVKYHKKTGKKTKKITRYKKIKLKDAKKIAYAEIPMSTSVVKNTKPYRDYYNKSGTMKIRWRGNGYQKSVMVSCGYVHKILDAKVTIELSNIPISVSLDERGVAGKEAVAECIVKK